MGIHGDYSWEKIKFVELSANVIISIKDLSKSATKIFNEIHAFLT